MGTFLQFVGGMVLAVGTLLLLGLAVVVFRSRKALRQLFETAALAGDGVTPARITLVPVVRLLALHHPERLAFAVLYDHDQAGAFCDLFLPLPDDRGITVSSAPSGGELDQVPGQVKRFEPGRSVAELLDRFDAESAGREPRRLAPGDFAAEMERSYAREMDWRNERGGPTEDEVRRIASGMAEAVSDEDISRVREHMAAAAAAQVQEACLEQFLSSTDLSPARWEKIRDDVVVIHARMTAEQARDEFCRASPTRRPTPTSTRLSRPRQSGWGPRTPIRARSSPA